MLILVSVAIERRYSASTHHTTEHVPEKKFKSEALLSTLTSDACKENAAGARAARRTRQRLPHVVNRANRARRHAASHPLVVSASGCRSNSTSSSSASSATNNIYGVNSSQPLTPYGLSSLPAGPAAGAGAISMAAAQAVQATAQVKSNQMADAATKKNLRFRLKLPMGERKLLLHFLVCPSENQAKGRPLAFPKMMFAIWKDRSPFMWC